MATKAARLKGMSPDLEADVVLYETGAGWKDPTRAARLRLCLYGNEIDEAALAAAPPFRSSEMPHLRRRDGSVTNW